jgi:hypothetical protein
LPQSGVTPPGIGEAEVEMQTMVEGYRGLRLLVNLNWDHLFSACIILISMCTCAFAIDAMTPR